MTFDLFRLHVLFSHGNKIVKMHSKTPRNNVNQNVNKAITKWSLIFTTISPIAGAWRIDQNDIVLKRSMDPWSMFFPHPNNSGNYNIELVQAESLRRIWGEGRRLHSFSVFLSIETKC